jgi:MFS family permease
MVTTSQLSSIGSFLQVPIIPSLPAVTLAMQLPRTTRLFLAGNTVAMVGNGLVLPFILIYLHQVRGIALPVVGALLAAAAVAGLIVVPISAAAIDRVGARWALIAIMLGQSIAGVLLALAHNIPTALPAMLLYGATWSPMFPTIAAMLAGLTPHQVMQQRAFAINFTAQNAALGIGAAVGAAVAGAHNPTSFVALFLANSASCLLFIAVLPFVPNPRRRRQDSEPRVGYRAVLAHPGLRLVIVASLLLAFTGYAAFDSGLPAFSTVVAHVSIRVVALSFTVNTALIVAAQLLVLRLIRRLRRSVAVSLTGLIWALSWAVLGLSALPIPPAARIACVFGFTGVFGLGETFIAPTLGPLINSLASDRIRGRANSISGLSTSLALIASPAIVTGFIAAGSGAAWIGLLCIGCLGTIVIGVVLGRRLTFQQDRVGLTAAVEPD